MTVVCVLDAKARLGEGPCWDARANCLWWIDIYGRAIHRFDPATQTDAVFKAPGPPGSLAVRAKGGLVVAMGDGFSFFDPQTGGFEAIVAPESDLPFTRFNDGRTDRQGRFWAGSIYEVEGEKPKPLANLYRLDADRGCTRMSRGIGISNGLAWSPGGEIMYHTDSCTPYVWAWEYDPATGDIDNRRLFIDLSDIDAVADGATVDAEGCYWVALPLKGLVHRYDPTGRLIRAIEMPVDFPTCCEFGGPALDVLYVTSATFDRPADTLADQPLAGGLFAIDAGVKGLPSAPFAA